MPRSRVAVVVLAVVASAVMLATARSNRTSIRFTEGTPHDLRVVASRAWDRFAAAFSGRSSCLGAVTVGVAWRLPDRARYEPGAALVLIRAPGTAGNLEASLLHEFAHHAEHRCPMDAAFRRRFLNAADLPAGTAWHEGEEWAGIPSERFAEAAVFSVLGEPPPHVLIPVGQDEVRAVEDWASGG